MPRPGNEAKCLKSLGPGPGTNPALLGGMDTTTTKTLRPGQATMIRALEKTIAELCDAHDAALARKDRVRARLIELQMASAREEIREICA